MGICLSLVVATATCLLTAADAQDDAKDDRAKFQGAWTARCEWNGSALLRDATVTFKDNTYVVMVKDSLWDEGTFTLNAGARPRSIDFVLKGGDDNGKTRPGIYEFDGDTLRICYTPIGAVPKDRPTEFSAKVYSPYVLYTLTKPKP